VPRGTVTPFRAPDGGAGRDSADRGTTRSRNELALRVFCWKIRGGVDRCRIGPPGDRLAREIDRKLRLTAAFLGAATRKDLARAFHRVNAATPFDVERAHKWLQGRATPREPQVYEDWA